MPVHVPRKEACAAKSAAIFIVHGDTTLRLVESVVQNRTQVADLTVMPEPVIFVVAPPHELAVQHAATLYRALHESRHKGLAQGCGKQQERKTFYFDIVHTHL
jgi:hypothetical protein